MDMNIELKKDGDNVVMVITDDKSGATIGVYLPHEAALLVSRGLRAVALSSEAVVNVAVKE